MEWPLLQDIAYLDIASYIGIIAKWMKEEEDRRSYVSTEWDGDAHLAHLLLHWVNLLSNFVLCCLIYW